MRAGSLPPGALYTLRAGEMVGSRRKGETFALEQDLVKIRLHPRRGGCVLLERDLCSIHPHRPLQCRHLECWSDSNAGDLEGLPRLDRRELFRDDPVALQLADEYDVKVPAARLARLLRRAAGGARGEAGEALSLLDLDHRLRAGIAARHGYDPDTQLLLLGRPALEVARAHGLRVAVREGEPTLEPAHPP